jgi:DNA-binding MarR family transcriptional regulator
MATEDGPSPRASRFKLERLARLMRQQGHGKVLGKGLVPVQWEALRYLARANVLSNSPGALARYLGATKGTISQSLLSLEKKGLISKSTRGDDARSVSLALTDQGKAMLAEDGQLILERDIENLSDKTQRRLDRALDGLLRAATLRLKEPSFGTCLTCRYFRKGGSGASDQCMKVSAALTDVETTLICIEHVER